MMRKYSLKNSTIISVLLKLIIVCSVMGFMVACSTNTNSNPQVPADSDENFVYHRVKYSGETYQIISTWYTKSAKNSNLLIELNPRIKPTRIKIGDLIKIPKELLLRPKSLPKDFVDSYAAPKQAKAESAPAAESMPAQTAPADEYAAAPAADYDYAETKVYEPAETKASPEQEPVAEPAKSIEPAPPVAEPQNAPAAEDPNAKIREKLMQELLQ